MTVLTDLTGKTAFVTGAAKRIGREIVLALAHKGTNIVFNYRKSASEAQDTKEALEALGIKALALQGDLTDLDACDRMIEKAWEVFGKVDILVNNASDFPRTPLTELVADRDRFERLFTQQVDIHMRAPLYLGMRLGLRMKANEVAGLLQLDTLSRDQIRAIRRQPDSGRGITARGERKLDCSRPGRPSS
jgi:NAD(P)-dependent dehydrogenase (short-subunit alcohol dehydrogenase family)